MLFEAKKLRQRIVQRLREKDGELQFDEAGREFLQVLVEVAAWIQDDAHAEAALHELVTVMVGLEESAPLAGADFREILSQSPAAIRRLAEFQAKPQAKFEMFTATVPQKVAPQFGEAAAGTPLHNLIPHNNRPSNR